MVLSCRSVRSWQLQRYTSFLTYSQKNYAHHCPYFSKHQLLIRFWVGFFGGRGEQDLVWAGWQNNCYEALLIFLPLSTWCHCYILNEILKWAVTWKYLIYTSIGRYWITRENTAGRTLQQMQQKASLVST